MAARTNPDDHTTDQAASWALTRELVDEILDADTILLGVPLYNYGPPSTIKAWLDHLIAPGLTIDTDSLEGKLGGREMIVIATRGGGYGPGTPREGWDHSEQWLPHALSVIGLQPKVITAELTLAHSNPKMSHLVHLAEASIANAHSDIDRLWPSGSTRTADPSP